jgi:hypothetical protein
MNKRDIDLKIYNVSKLMEMLISIEKAIEIHEDIKYKNELNVEFNSRLNILREQCKELSDILDNWFIYEKEANIPNDFSYRQVQKSIKGFI